MWVSRDDSERTIGNWRGRFEEFLERHRWVGLFREF